MKSDAFSSAIAQAPLRAAQCAAACIGERLHATYPMLDAGDDAAIRDLLALLRGEPLDHSRRRVALNPSSSRGRSWAYELQNLARGRHHGSISRATTDPVAVMASLAWWLAGLRHPDELRYHAGPRSHVEDMPPTRREIAEMVEVFTAAAT